jgi:cysteine desulfurase
MKSFFLDTNAHISMGKSAQKAYIDFQNSPAGKGHPSSKSSLGLITASVLEINRAKIAKLLGAKSSDQIIFTSTCTQACEWGLDIFSKWCLINNNKLFYSSIEHPAIKYYIDHKLSNYNNLINFGLDFEKIEYKPDNFVICMGVQNESGLILPINNIKNAHVLSDMCQMIGKVPINLSEMNIDIGIFGAHKFGGPFVGILYLKDPSKWMAFGTGSRYFCDRAGTPDVAGIVATATALEETLSEMSVKLIKMRSFQAILEKKLTENEIKVILMNKDRVANTTLLKIPKIAIQVLHSLSEENIYVGSGSACSSKDSSPLMELINEKGGMNDLIRISTDGSYDENDALYVAGRIIKLTQYYKNKL